VRCRGPTKQRVWLGAAGYFCGCRRRITDADTDGDSDSNRNINSNCNADGNTNSDTYTDSNTNSHRHRDSDGDGDPHCKTLTATAAASYAAAQALIPELARRSPPRAGRRRVIGDPPMPMLRRDREVIGNGKLREKLREFPRLISSVCEVRAN
jgi:hypothetical protein